MGILIEWEVSNLDLEEAESIQNVIQRAMDSVLQAHPLIRDPMVFVRFVDDTEMREINNAHRGVDATTDVLSFPLHNYKRPGRLPKNVELDPVTGKVMLGDLLISVPRAYEQAERFEHPPEREFGFLAAHGLLHLLGYDHMTEEDTRLMRTQEEYALRAVGLTRDMTSQLNEREMRHAWELQTAWEAHAEKATKAAQEVWEEVQRREAERPKEGDLQEYHAFLRERNERRRAREIQARAEQPAEDFGETDSYVWDVRDIRGERGTAASQEAAEWEAEAEPEEFAAPRATPAPARRVGPKLGKRAGADTGMRLGTDRETLPFVPVPGRPGDAAAGLGRSADVFGVSEASEAVDDSELSEAAEAETRGIEARQAKARGIGARQAEMRQTEARQLEARQAEAPSGGARKAETERQEARPERRSSIVSWDVIRPNMPRASGIQATASYAASDAFDADTAGDAEGMEGTEGTDGADGTDGTVGIGKTERQDVAGRRDAALDMPKSGTTAGAPTAGATMTGAATAGAPTSGAATSSAATSSTAGPVRKYPSGMIGHSIPPESREVTTTPPESMTAQTPPAPQTQLTPAPRTPSTLQAQAPQTSPTSQTLAQVPQTPLTSQTQVPAPQPPAPPPTQSDSPTLRERFPSISLLARPRAKQASALQSPGITEDEAKPSDGAAEKPTGTTDGAQLAAGIAERRDGLAASWSADIARYGTMGETPDAHEAEVYAETDAPETGRFDAPYARDAVWDDSEVPDAEWDAPEAHDIVWEDAEAPDADSYETPEKAAAKWDDLSSAYMPPKRWEPDTPEGEQDKRAAERDALWFADARQPQAAPPDADEIEAPEAEILDALDALSEEYNAGYVGRGAAEWRRTDAGFAALSSFSEPTQQDAETDETFETDGDGFDPLEPTDEVEQWAGVSAANIRQITKMAISALRMAYAPYSRFPVGAALLSADGHVILGCNVENASYGLSMCAERSAVFTAVANGMRNFSLLVVAAENAIPWPCGACRQVLSEFAPELPIIALRTEGGVWAQRARLGELLPNAFSGEFL